MTVRPSDSDSDTEQELELRTRIWHASVAVDHRVHNGPNKLEANGHGSIGSGLQLGRRDELCMMRVDWRRGIDTDRTQFFIAVHRTRIKTSQARLEKPSAL